jgi:hypothetical protein
VISGSQSPISDKGSVQIIETKTKKAKAKKKAKKKPVTQFDPEQ